MDSSKSDNRALWIVSMDVAGMLEILTATFEISVPLKKVFHSARVIGFPTIYFARILVT